MKNTVVFDLEVVAETFTVPLVCQCVPGKLFPPLFVVIVTDVIFKYLVIDGLSKKFGRHGNKHRLAHVQSHSA
jgi:hypothetical protein